MKKNKGIRKELLSLAGEHRVASELCKLGIFATITPGNRKQADLYAINDIARRFLRIEVKASQTGRFITGIGQRTTRAYNPPAFWVLVLFDQGCERFFVLKNREIERLQQEVNAEYSKQYRKRHDGKKFVGKGVYGLSLADIEKAKCENCWEKLVAAVGGAEA